MTKWIWGLILLFATPLAQAQAPLRPVATEATDRATIVEMFGKRTIEVGEMDNYRVRLADGAVRPIEYFWDFGDGSQAQGNNVSHIFDRTGRFRVEVRVRNGYGTDSDFFFVTVTEPTGLAARQDEETPEETQTPTPTARTAEDPPAVAATATPRTPKTRPAFLNTILWSRGGYTWIVESHTVREAADYGLQKYRDAGYTSGVYVDQSGSGSPAFRVVVGQYASEEQALRAKDQLPEEILTAILLKLPTDQQ